MKRFAFIVLVSMVLLFSAEAQSISADEVLEEKKQLIETQQDEIKMLKAQLAFMQEEHARRNLLQVNAALNLKDFKGLRIKSDQALVSMGKAEDVVLWRSGPKKASLMGDLDVKGVFSVKGMDLLKRLTDLEKNAGSDLKVRLSTLEGKVNKLATLDDKVKKLSSKVDEIARDQYIPPIPKYAWDYTKDIVWAADNSVQKTSVQGWNKAGAYSTPSCKSGDCRLTTVLKSSSNNKDSHNLHFYIHLSSSAGTADAPRSDIWCCGGDREETGSVFSNRGVNNDQKSTKGDCKIGSLVSIGFEGQDVVCRCNTMEMRRWKNSAKWPARAGFTLWDAKPFALSNFKTYGFNFVSKQRPIWVYKNKVSISGQTMTKVGAQGWNGAGAWTGKTCTKGNCQLLAKIVDSSKNTNTHNLHFYVALTTESRLADAPHGNMWCCGGDRQSNGNSYSNKGVNNGQQWGQHGKVTIGAIISVGFEGNDVVCRAGDHEFRRWKGEAKWPVRATVSFWDAAPFALTDFEVKNF